MGNVHNLRLALQITDQGVGYGTTYYVQLPNLPDDVIREDIRREYREEVAELNRDVNIALRNAEQWRSNFNSIRRRNLWQRIRNRS